MVFTPNQFVSLVLVWQHACYIPLACVFVCAQLVLRVRSGERAIASAYPAVRSCCKGRWWW